MWGEPDLWGGEAAYCGERLIGQSEPLGKMGSRVKAWCKEETKSFQAGLGIKSLTFEMNREEAGRLIAPGGPPVDELSLWDGKRNINRRGSWLELHESALEEMDIGSLGGGGNGDGAVINVGDDEAPENFHVQGGHVYDNEKGEMGEPWGFPTEMGVKVQGDPWKVRRQVRPRRKDPTHCTR